MNGGTGLSRSSIIEEDHDLNRIAAAARELEMEDSLYLRLLSLFYERSREDLLALDAALAKDDRRAGGEAAHSVKGAARSLALEDIATAAQGIEEELRNLPAEGRVDMRGMADRTASLLHALERLEAALRRLKPGDTGSQAHVDTRVAPPDAS